MSEYIIEIPDEYFASYDTERDMYYPDERDSAMRITPIVRCRDCKHYDEDIHSCDWWSAYERLAEPDGFCAWGERANFATCKCGEDIELGNRESAVCPRCNRTVRA